MRRLFGFSFALLMLLGCLGGIAWNTGRAAAAPSTWSVVSSPSQNLGDDYLFNYLKGVSCTGPSSCMAVGYYYNLGEQTLIESWNGSSWNIVGGPDETGDDNYLEGVSCFGTSFCVAVGYYYNSDSGNEALIETWNGSSWSITPAANLAVGNSLFAVSCTNQSSCMAVGNEGGGPGGAGATLTEQWNGIAWSVDPSPTPGMGTSSVPPELDGVTCTSAAKCTSVGWTFNKHHQTTLIESWNGTKWRVISSPSPGTQDQLFGVSCPKSNSCKAVGYYYDGSDQTLVESLTGTVWSIDESPNRHKEDELAAVSCTSNSDCVAVGSIEGSRLRPVIESWSGDTWSIAPSPKPEGNGPYPSQLYGVACSAFASCVAVGYVAPDTPPAQGINQTLVELGS